MGLRGPAKRPDVLAKLEGKPASERVVATGTAGDPPDHLSEMGKKVWLYTVENAAPGLIAAVDAMALSAYCEAAAEFAELCHWYENNPHEHIVESEKGGLYQHPNMGRKNKAAERLLRFGDRFGLTPAARASLGEAIGSKPVNAFEQWRQQKKSG